MPTFKRAQKKTNARSSVRTKHHARTRPWTAGLFRTRRPQEMTAAQRRRLRSWNKGRKIEDEGWTIVEYLPLPDKRVEYGVWHVPACWRGCEGWILVSGSWIPVQFTRDFGIERLRKREFNTLFSYLPPLPEEAFDDYKAKTPAAEPK